MTPKKLILSFFCLCLALSSNAQDMFTVSKGLVVFFSHAPIEDITAENKQPASMINVITREIAVIIPIRNFRFAKELMHEHFNDKYMESEKFPMASFKGLINDSIDISKDREFPVSAKGILTIHGIEKEVTLEGQMKRTGNYISLTSEFKVAIKDFNIAVPRLLFENIAETIDVRISLEYKPFQKTNSSK